MPDLVLPVKVSTPVYPAQCAGAYTGKAEGHAEESVALIIRSPEVHAGKEVHFAISVADAERLQAHLRHAVEFIKAKKGNAN